MGLEIWGEVCMFSGRTNKELPMNLSELGIFPKNIPCKHEDCLFEQTTIPIQVGLAIIRYNLKTNARYTLELRCESCDKLSTYSLAEILELIPTSQQPQEAPEGISFPLVLHKLNAPPGLNHPSFGEILKAKVLVNEQGQFRAELLSKSILFPNLEIGTLVNCSTLNGIPIIESFLNSTNYWQPVRPEMPKKNNGFGMFFLMEDAKQGNLVSANVKCSNPSCTYIFSKTAKELRQLLNTYVTNIVGFDEKYFGMECPRCNCCTIITKKVIDELYQL